VPDGVEAEEASFVEPVNTCLKAVRRAALQPGESVLVVGQGPIGLLLTQLCRRSGAEPIVTDPLPDRREMALRLGAAVALPAGDEVPAEVRRLTGRGADAALVAALGTDALRQAIDAVRPAGRIIVFAATSPGEMAEIDLGALCAAEKELLTSYSASVDVQDLAARLVFDREVRVRDLITHRFPLEQAARALEVAARPAPGVLKVMLRPDARREGAPDGSR
jgi:L-iditol 2-dehydrogenase